MPQIYARQVFWRNRSKRGGNKNAGQRIYYKKTSIFLCGDDVGKTSTGGRGEAPDNFYLVHSKT